MCGIAGIVSLNRKLVDQERLKKMADAIAHRGPDGEGYWINISNTVGFGHRRLSVIDLSPSGAQPMQYLNRYSIVYNGEIYNYIEVKKRLTALGYAFTSQSDTEVILAAYACWKKDCLQYFDGMFAFAIWDEIEQTLFAARDRFGEKPFFYWQNNECLVFASEIKALWRAGIEKCVNNGLLYNFITLGYTQNPYNAEETAYSQVLKLPAASYFTLYAQQPVPVAPVCYWELPPANAEKHITEQDAISRFADLFQQSVQKRLRSDVPLGTSLSGGLDSSSIAVTIHQQQSAIGTLKTFSAVFPGFITDETKHIEKLVAATGIANYTVIPTAESFIADFEKLCYYQEGLIGSASVYAQYKVFELARQQGIVVLLDGQGADETLAGYYKYFQWYWQQLYKSDRTLLRHELNAAKELGITEDWSWKNKVAASLPQLAGAYLKNARRKNQLQTGDVAKEFAAANGISYYQLPIQDGLNNVLRYNIVNNGLEELLQYADRNSMAHGREVRLPFLSYELVEFIMAVPAAFKIKNGRTKWLLRKSMEHVLPPEITWRKDKIGFEPPQKQWMQHPVVQEYIQHAKRTLVERGILGKQVLTKKIQPQDSHAAENFDWRYLAASKLFNITVC